MNRIEETVDMILDWHYIECGAYDCSTTAEEIEEFRNELLTSEVERDKWLCLMTIVENN